MTEDRENIISEINSFTKEIAKNAFENYVMIRHCYINEYEVPEIDPLRYEICICLTLSLYQAAITLTNHLIEKYLKIALVYYETNEKIGGTNLESIFKTGVDTYSDTDFSSTINACCTKGIITKSQKKDLHTFRRNIRNPFSHADMKQTFDGMTVPVTFGKIDYTDTENLLKVERESEVDLRHFVPFQGIAQVIISEKISFQYFEYVDHLIRMTIGKFIK
jgi:hypothetical protein